MCFKIGKSFGKMNYGGYTVKAKKGFREGRKTSCSKRYDTNLVWACG
jgi:hypothetical protein